MTDAGAFEFDGLQIPVEQFPIGKRGRRYRANLAATGGSGNYTWSVVAGSLPPGLNLNPQTGELWGKSVIRGTWNFTVEARDSENNSLFVQKELSIAIRLY